MERTGSLLGCSQDEALAAKEAGPVDDSLRKVAMVYRVAQATQGRPTAAVQQAFDLPYRTAGSWIQKAKFKGYTPDPLFEGLHLTQQAPDA